LFEASMAAQPVSYVERYTRPVVVEREIVALRAHSSCELIFSAIVTFIMILVSIIIGDWYFNAFAVGPAPTDGQTNFVNIETTRYLIYSSPVTTDYAENDYPDGSSLGKLYAITVQILIAALVFIGIAIIVHMLAAIRNCCHRHRVGVYFQSRLWLFLQILLTLVWTVLVGAAFINYAVHHASAYNDDNGAFCGSSVHPPQCGSFYGDGYFPLYGFYLIVAAFAIGLWELSALLSDLSSVCCHPYEAAV